jgi:hypothetical protein
MAKRLKIHLKMRSPRPGLGLSGRVSVAMGQTYHPLVANKRTIA